MKYPNNNLQLKILFVLFSLSIIFHLSSNNCLSQTSAGLSAIPPRVENIKVKPGDVYSTIIKVRNESGSIRSITTDIKDFVVKADSPGTPVQIDDTTPKDNRWSAANWIHVSPTQFQLQPGETKGLTLTILVPDNALPGGHYAMVLHSAADQSLVTNTGSAVQANVGTLVYIIVAGDIKEHAVITDFSAPRFSEFGPINFQAIINNLSDIHITPIGQITVTNWFGGHTASLSLPSTNIFPYTSRTLTTDLDRKWLFGRFKASLLAGYGSTGQSLSAVSYFWVIPWRLLILIASIIIITLVLIQLLRHLPPKNQRQKMDKLEHELEKLRRQYQDN